MLTYWLTAECSLHWGIWKQSLLIQTHLIKRSLHYFQFKFIWFKITFTKGTTLLPFLSSTLGHLLTVFTHNYWGGSINCASISLVQRLFWTTRTGNIFLHSQVQMIFASWHSFILNLGRVMLVHICWQILKKIFSKT